MQLTKTLIPMALAAATCMLPSNLVAQQSGAQPEGARSMGVATGNLIVHAAKLHTVSGEMLTDAIVVIRNGKIEAIGPAGSTLQPADFEIIKVPVATPGLIDAHTVVGLAGYLNQKQDQDQLEKSEPMQPELRALDAYNAREPLIEWVRSFGVTTMHTGHGPGTLISGETMIVKTRGGTVDEAMIVKRAMIAATLGDSSQAHDGKSPGTRGKQVAMLRELLVKGQGYEAKKTADKDVDLDLRMEAVGRLLRKELPLMVTANRHQDILAAIRLAREFDLRLVLDGAAEAYLLLDEIKQSGVSVIVHPTMQRATGETENLSMETAAKLQAAGIPFAQQSGFESYVPKTRVVLFEAAISAANGLSREQALYSITLGAAQLLGIDKRVGSLEIGKDGDLAFYDGDPFEYTSHCLGTVIEGHLVSTKQR
ncbi:MAG: imidazolonepropionase-like amidohydrolase [Planctomycetota bacterium]|jgi:imidazolonepropionase-like amidohydrolase